MNDFTVEKLLAVEQSRGMHCIAGFNGLSNMITGFTIIDVPHVTDWMKGGEFVVSAGYFTSVMEGHYFEFVLELVVHKCAALGIKLHYYHDRIPEELIDAANQYNLPLIELDYSLLFSDIAFAVYQNMFMEKLEKNQRIQYLFQKMMEAILSESDLEIIMYYIYLIIQCPVYILNGDLHCLGWENENKTKGITKNSICLDEKYTAFSKEICDKLLTEYDETKFKTFNFIINKTEEDTERYAIAPIEYNHSLLGFLVVYDMGKELVGEQYKLIEKVCSVINLFFLKNYMVGKKGGETEKSFINMVLLPENADVETIKHYSILYGFPYNRKRICIDFQIDGFDNGSYVKKYNVRNTISRTINDITTGYSRETYKIQFDNNFSIFIFASKNDKNNELFEEAELLSLNIKKSLEKYALNIMIGISNITERVQDIPLSYKQGIEMISLGKKLKADNNIFTYQKMGIDYFLWSSCSEEKLNTLAEPIIKLFHYDIENKSENLNTLEAYIQNRYNITRAAKELHLHRNTFIYRFEIIRRIVEMDLIDQNELLLIQIGLHAFKLLNI